MKLKDKKTGLIYNVVSQSIYESMMATGNYSLVKEKQESKNDPVKEETKVEQ
jgi:hypothetical protein